MFTHEHEARQFVRYDEDKGRWVVRLTQLRASWIEGSAAKVAGAAGLGRFVSTWRSIWETKVKFWRWEKGRQNTGYEKLLLLGAHWPIPFDLYLLRFREGVYIPPHTDRVESGRHYRLNIVLRKAKAGGEFMCDSPIYESSWIKYFRSDIAEHSVSEVQSGTRYVLSLGWVRRS